MSFPDKGTIIDVDYLHRAYPNTFKYSTPSITLYRAGGDFIKSTLNTGQRRGVIIVSSNRIAGISTTISDMLQYTFDGSGKGVTINTFTNGHSDLHTNIKLQTDMHKLLPNSNVNIIRDIYGLRGRDIHNSIVVADGVLNPKALVDVATLNIPFIMSTTPDTFMQVYGSLNNSPDIMVMTL